MGVHTPYADEAEDPPADLDPLAVQDGGARARVLPPQRRHVDVAVGRVRRCRERREHLGVLLAHRLLDRRRPVHADPAPQPGAEFPGLLEAPGGAEFDEAVGVLDAEQVGEDAAGVVGVVEEEDQVAETDQGVGAVAGSGQVTGVAVHVADHVDAGPWDAGGCGCHGDQA
jgi:hypothetical protein